MSCKNTLIGVTFFLNTETIVLFDIERKLLGDVTRNFNEVLIVTFVSNPINSSY